MIVPLLFSCVIYYRNGRYYSVFCDRLQLDLRFRQVESWTIICSHHAPEPAHPTVVRYRGKSKQPADPPLRQQTRSTDPTVGPQMFSTSEIMLDACGGLCWIKERGKKMELGITRSKRHASAWPLIRKQLPRLHRQTCSGIYNKRRVASNATVTHPPDIHTLLSRCSY